VRLSTSVFRGVAGLILAAWAAGHAPAALAQSAWSSEAVWDGPSDSLELVRGCGRESRFPDPVHPEDRACIVNVIRESGGSDQAVRFFEAADEFLRSFTERGAVDLGFASAPWFNMGRGHIVFLNGSPSIIYMNEVVPKNWNEHPDYAGPAFPWSEYAHVLDPTLLPDGRQQMLAALSMRECRACPEAGEMRILLTFGADGALQSAELLPLLNDDRRLESSEVQEGQP
jgi:hypothetical protein